MPTYTRARVNKHIYTHARTHIRVRAHIQYILANMNVCLHVVSQSHSYPILAADIPSQLGYWRRDHAIFDASLLVLIVIVTVSSLRLI